MNIKYVFWTIYAVVCISVIYISAYFGLTSPISIATLLIGLAIVLGLTKICRRVGYDPNRKR